MKLLLVFLILGLQPYADHPKFLPGQECVWISIRDNNVYADDCRVVGLQKNNWFPYLVNDKHQPPTFIYPSRDFDPKRPELSGLMTKEEWLQLRRKLTKGGPTNLYGIPIIQRQ